MFKGMLYIYLGRKAEMKKTYIYALLDPSSKEIRYIGKSSNIKNRMANHLCPSSLKKNTHKNNWLKKIKCKPLVKILCTCKLKNANKFEKYYISKYKNLGARLTNGTNGGDGWPEGLTMPKTEARIKANQRLNKPVYTVNIKTKKIKHFNSIKDCAIFLKCCKKLVSFHLRKRIVKSIKGYIVYYKNQQNKSIEYKRHKAVIGVHLFCNKILYFDKIVDAELEGFNANCISAICSRRKYRKYHKNYSWFYA